MDSSSFHPTSKGGQEPVVLLSPGQAIAATACPQWSTTAGNEYECSDGSTASENGKCSQWDGLGRRTRDLLRCPMKHIMCEQRQVIEGGKRGDRLCKVQEVGQDVCKEYQGRVKCDSSLNVDKVLCGSVYQTDTHTHIHTYTHTHTHTQTKGKRAREGAIYLRPGIGIESLRQHHVIQCIQQEPKATMDG